MKDIKCLFEEADILLPDFSKIDGKKWSVIACDQYTSEINYWQNAEKLVGDAPSTLNLILPEVYLSETEKRLYEINKTMDTYLENVLVEHKNSMLYVERVQSDGGIRKGIIGKVDLLQYDYQKGADSYVRATEGTVLSRIPPRVHIRENASLELPHIMMLIDDDKKAIIEEIGKRKDKLTLAYSYNLMLNGGHISAYFLRKEDIDFVKSMIEKLADKEEIKRKYGEDNLPPLVFAVGDGNHSLASAKAHFENIKSKIGEENALSHPSRYALIELVNLHDDALKFEPIYRVVFGADKKDLYSELDKYNSSLKGKGKEQKMTIVEKDKKIEYSFKNPIAHLTVGTLEKFLENYQKTHDGVKVDYIHGGKSVSEIVDKNDAVGFIFDGMKKNELFKTVIFDGALPRKTFSMGHADDKRFYTEARKIIK